MNVIDILKLDPQKDWDIINENYRADAMEKVVINGNTFTNYGDFQFMWEKSYVKSPVRSASGMIENLNSYATFATPHLIMDFSIMSIDDFRAIVRMDLEQNEFVVECYDPIFNKRNSFRMYFATLEMAKLHNLSRKRFNSTQNEWEDFIEIVGVNEYKVELIGTNVEGEEVTITYNLNPPSDTGAINVIESVKYPKNSSVVIGADVTYMTDKTFNGKYTFQKWNISPNGNPTGNYLNGVEYTIITDTVLYAQWQKTE